ncbi:serine/threonine-protein kinase [Streptomyces hyaluromycini]|uniref:serine/threonine-protein kinase n=1 Tax=Streptomyces hyaluromycini TaxID=1377993 RepID=UPI000B5CE0C4|nr:serine/threonine-protein kinase [Streptomyces hyaluromycini]
MQPLERIGRYRLEQRLGTGAFGTVWLAYDDQLDAPVAVKVLADNWSHRLDIHDRFLSEARLLRRADSKRVVQVYDIGELPDGRPYFVMEYADAGTLADLLGGGPLPIPDALRLTALAARGAADLHGAGIVHRDIKPTNVLLRTAQDGTRRVLLADLGLAKSLAQASGLTLAAGSAGYQPPEQARPGEGIDARADVYALGAVGYELVTGTVPAAPGQVVRPERLRPDLGDDVQRALMRALEPDRQRRWPTAQAFADELDRLAATAAARRPRRLDGVRRRLNVVTLTLAAVLAAGGTALAVTLTHRDGTPSAETKVSDATGRVVAEVPSGWAGELRNSGWNPQALGLASGHEPGLEVADDVSEWQDLTAAVNGVFIGASEHGDVTAKVNALTHSGCHYDGSRAFTGTEWKGRVRSWSGCSGAGGSIQEAALKPAGGDSQPQVYVQVRQKGAVDKATTDGILGSLRVT